MTNDVSWIQPRKTKASRILRGSSLLLVVSSRLDHTRRRRALMETVNLNKIYDPSYLQYNHRELQDICISVRN
jgi:hypothetical protein